MNLVLEKKNDLLDTSGLLQKISKDVWMKPDVLGFIEKNKHFM
jgi:hypothetical protein